jgi:2-keto-4-pentenoate hydratase/2-oxohepta-3-ene-1,7-dioic acid hydratase in catechol pathway
VGLHAPSLAPYNSVDAILANWDSAKTLLTNISENPGSKATPLDRVKLNQPINNPGAIYCAAANYYDHAKEMGTNVNKKEIQPYFFIKSSSVLENMVTERN